MTSKAKLTLGPVLFNWPPEKWRDFYFRIADEAAVDCVTLGEVVCSKRLPFFEPLMADVIERLQGAGKEVVLSTLALIMSKREMDIVRDITAMNGLLVEANDVSTATLLAGRPHTIGPFINIYNEGTLAFFAKKGATRVCLPVELSGKTLSVLSKNAGLELEVLAFGRLPLAVSARCYHARAHSLSKDNCQYVCTDDPDGMDLDTLDGEAFLALNGTQTLSYSCNNLIEELAEMQQMGINRFRLSPHDIDMVGLAGAFRDVLDGKSPGQELEELAEGLIFSNGYYHDVEGGRRVAAE
ncbi:MAG: U32 family peptidase [Rhodospirillales bacterium]|nr:U32 family peptidase [Rhodospirillales bacterium]